MLRLTPLDQLVPLFQQFSSDLLPVVLVNIFRVGQDVVLALSKAWDADANWSAKLVAESVDGLI